MHANSLANLRPKPWKPGQSGNPGGRPKKDFAQIIARAAFEENPAMIYRGVAKKLASGDAAMLTAAGDRAYGKVVQKVNVDGNLDTHNFGRLAALLERAAERAAQSSRSK